MDVEYKANLKNFALEKLDKYLDLNINLIQYTLGNIKQMNTLQCK